MKLVPHNLRCLVSFLVLGACTFSLQAEPAPTAGSAKKLHVVTQIAEPFVLEQDGKLSGYSIELWNRVAKEAGFSFDYEIVKTVPEMLRALRSGKADVAVAALTISAEREKTMDFSYPIYQSGLKIAVPDPGNRDFFSKLSGFYSVHLLVPFAVISAILLLASFLSWKFRAPAHSGRLSPVRWLSKMALTLVALFLSSVLVAVISSTLTVSRYSTDIKTLSDLPGRAVGTLEGTSSDDELQDIGVQPKYYPDLRAALEALKNGKLDAVVYDAPLLAYEVEKMKGDLQLLPTLFSRQAYGFGMKNNSGDLRKKVNLALQSMSDEGVLDKLDEQWLGKQK